MKTINITIDYTIAPGYNTTGFDPKIPIKPFSRELIDNPVDITGAFGRILAIWSVHSRR
jgi:hypothetical protein